MKNRRTGLVLYVYTSVYNTDGCIYVRMCMCVCVCVCVYQIKQDLPSYEARLDRKIAVCAAALHNTWVHRLCAVRRKPRERRHVPRAHPLMCVYGWVGGLVCGCGWVCSSDVWVY